MRGRKDIYSVLGQLIDTSYIIKIAGEINQKLAQQGQLNHNVLDKYLGKLIHGEQDKNDPKVYFTESFIARTKAKIKGLWWLLLSPPISIILNQIDVKDKMFFSLFEQLSPYGFLTARTTTAMYVPNVYSRSQNEWVQNFYKQNGLFKKQFVNENIMALKSCVISQNLLERIEADIDECISSKSYVDLQSNLRAALSGDDIKLIVDKVLTLQKQRNIIILGNYLLSKAFIESLMKECEIYLQDQVKAFTPILNSNGLEIARKLYETTVADRTAARRHTHNDAQNKVNALLGDVRLFEKGVKCFTVDAQQNLYKYLLKTVCLDILNELLDYIASERGLNIDANKFNNEQRQKFINDLPVEYKSSFQILLKTVLGQNLDEFMTAVEECLTLCSMILKKIDKKKDRLIILNHKHSLLEQLDKCEDPALVLHLSSLVIFITATQSMLHCSGRHVFSRF
ncbi:hypothetical protein RN001_007043 [Aquatica leii]|uniref:E3 UFM1-protein ligase 1 homolog n=1 Tax=Aquatica leii TaxID=1421715 RepID=A0AAN7SK87_9COLE|nr:hypothetical protein RN001_007043 [Aquatica leii]